MPKTEQGTDAPEINSPETAEIIKELQEEGHEVQGVASEDKPKEVPEKPETPEEPKVEPEKVEPEVEEEPKAPVKRETREPKEPKQVNAWEVEKDKRQAKKAQQERDDVLLKEIQSLKEDVTNLKQDKQTTTEPEDNNSKIDKLSEQLEKGEINTAQFTKEVVKIRGEAPQAELSDETKEKLGRIDKLEEAQRKTKEDAEFSTSFDSEATESIKEDYPDASAEDIKAIKAKVKALYFQPKYINLSPKEIYTLNKTKLSDDISPPSQTTLETGKKGVGRQGEVIDYENITDEKFDKLSPEEQDKVMDYKVKKQQEASGITVHS